MTFTFATGAAFLDRAGSILAGDPGFHSLLGLPAEGASAALRARAEVELPLRAFLTGSGPELLELAGPAGGVQLRRVDGEGGYLVLARPARAAEWLEHVGRSQGLPRLVAGVAHDIKNPLNAMALQLALLTEKLSGAGDVVSAAGGHLTAIREQIGRVNEVVRRFLDVTDPAAPLGYTDLGGLVSDAAALYGHDARRRQIELVVEAPRGTVRTRCDPARVARLVLAIFTGALAEVPDAGRLVVRAAAEGQHAVVRLEHGVGDLEGESGYDSAVASGTAEALGGGLAVERGGGVVRLTLRLPRNDRS